MRKRKEKIVYEPVEEENEFPDIYNEQTREKMLEDDEITAAESGFMTGRELFEKKKKKSRSWLETEYHHDTKSTLQSQKDYEDD